MHAVEGARPRPSSTARSSALLGSSGCGKTSTLRMIAGFEDVTDGSIALGGRPIHTLPPAQRGVAMAFEGYSLYPPLTVRDNIAFALQCATRLPRRGGRRAGRRDRRAARDRRHPRPLSHLDLRRPAAARQPCPRAGPPAPTSISSTSRWASSSRSCAPMLRGRIKHYLHRARA